MNVSSIPASEKASSRRNVNPVIALVLSMFVLPGMGQLVTGRLLKGIIMAGGLALCIPAVIFKILRDFSLIMPQLAERSAQGEVLNFTDFQNAAAPLAGGLFWFLLPPVVIWAWSATDSIIYIYAVKKAQNEINSAG